MQKMFEQMCHDVINTLSTAILTQKQDFIWVAVHQMRLFQSLIGSEQNEAIDFFKKYFNVTIIGSINNSNRKIIACILLLKKSCTIKIDNQSVKVSGIEKSYFDYNPIFDFVKQDKDSLFIL